MGNVLTQFVAVSTLILADFQDFPADLAEDSPSTIDIWVLAVYDERGILTGIPHNNFKVSAVIHPQRESLEFNKTKNLEFAWIQTHQITKVTNEQLQLKMISWTTNSKLLGGSENITVNIFTDT